MPAVNNQLEFGLLTACRGGAAQPRGTVVEGNICHEIGLWQKQSSLWFQAVTAQTVLKDNIFFNGPRAAFNFNGEGAALTASCCGKLAAATPRNTV
jgi:hypothetical protein